MAIDAPVVDEFGDPIAAEEAPPAAPEPPAAPAEEAPSPPPWAGRFQSAEELWQEFQNVDTLRGRQANELGELRQQVAAAQAAPAQAAPAQAAPNQPMVGELTVQQFQAWKEEEPEEAAFYFAEVRVQEAEARAAAQIKEAVEPLQRGQYQAGAKAAVDMLRSELGDETVLRYEKDLGQRIAQDEAFFVDTSTLHTRMSDFVKAREYERLTTPQRNRADDGTYAPGSAVPPVHVEGGSTPPPSSAAREPVDPIIEEMDLDDPGRDAFGALRPG